MTILQALRIYGPCEISRLAAATGLSWSMARTEVVTLIAKDLAERGDAFSGWSVTELGRRMVDHHEVESVTAVRRDEARACVGVRT